MRELIDGLHRFQKGVFGEDAALFTRLAKGQDPDALFITCSDSRIVPTLMTQTQPGDLFILRNAGNMVPAWGVNSGEAATIEYAIEALGINDIIVCGHTHCGAMKAVLHPESTTELPAVRDWLKHAEGARRILKQYGPLSEAEALDVIAEENVLAQIENLRTHPSVMAALSAGRLNLHAWVYDLEDGSVHAYHDTRGQFVPVAEAGQGFAEDKSRLGGRREI